MGPKVEDRVKRRIRPEIAALQSYHVQSASGMIKLDAMENPFSWPGTIEAQWLGRLKEAQVNRYPDPHASRLAKKVRDYFRLPGEMSLMFGNGSDELIQIMAMALSGKNRAILAPEPGFVMYRMIAEFVGMSYVGVPLQNDFSLDVSAMKAAIQANDPSLIFLAQPNNPTGNVFTLEDTCEIIESCDGLVVIDEAYLPFTDTDHLRLASAYDNVVIMRTFSKMGLAGLRLGMLIGASAWLNEFEKIRLPYNINSLTQLSAEFALDHVHVLESQAQELRAERTKLFERLSAIKACKAYPSEANFLLVNVSEGYSAKAVFEQMKEAGVLVKCMDGSHPLLKNCLRLTVGTPTENNAMMDALAGALNLSSEKVK